MTTKDDLEFTAWLDESQKNEIKEWCKNNCIGDVIIYHYGSLFDTSGCNYKLKFEEESDLIATKLKWL